MMLKTVLMCEACDTGFWTPQKVEGQLLLCPNCLQAPLVEAESETVANLLLPEPEGILPFSVSSSLLQANLNNFIQRIPFKPRDLNVPNLMNRLQKVYMPLWWVDVAVKAQWQAEAGFDYEVVSHQDAYQGGWISREVKETRVKWEPRVGLLERQYQNIPAAALLDDREFKTQSGGFNLGGIQLDLADQINGVLVRLAQRDSQDAWSEAELNLRNTAGEQCREACKAQHIRQFQWTAEYADHHWTQLLLPVYMTYYTDINRKRHWVMINGQNGKVSGDLNADLSQAIVSSMWILAAGAIVFFIGLIASAILSMKLIGVLLIIGGIWVALFSAYPFGRAWLFNRNQIRDEDGALT